MSDRSAFAAVLDRVVEVLSRHGFPFAAIGGIASIAWGRPRWDPSTADVDLLVRPQDAPAAQEALVEDGFRVVPTQDDHWLLRVERDGIGVDLVFRTAGDVYLDDEMVERIAVQEVEGVRLPVLSAEDLLVNKALAFSEQTPTYWAEALAILPRVDLDWDYVVRRARHGVHRVLSLLLYAMSQDLPVPPAAVRQLFAMVDDDGAAERGEEPWQNPRRALRTT